MTTHPASHDLSAPPRIWQTFAQGGVWIVAAVLPFILEPPGYSLSADSGTLSWVALARFIVAVLNGLALLVAFIYGHREHLSRWILASVSGLAIGFVVLGLYGSFMLPWTCLTNTGQRLVIGTQLHPKALDYYNAGHFACADLLNGFATDPLLVWDSNAIYEREVFLGWLFVLSVSFIGIGIISLLQAHKILIQSRSLRSDP